MTQTFQFELVSPEAKLMSEPVAMAVVPGGEGDFGVMAGHAPLVATVRTGVVSIYRDNINTVSERIFIAGGFADVTGENCTILAEQAINVNDLDKADIARQIQEAEAELKNAADGADKRRLQKRVEILKAMHEATL